MPKNKQYLCVNCGVTFTESCSSSQKGQNFGYVDVKVLDLALLFYFILYLFLIVLVCKQIHVISRQNNDNNNTPKLNPMVVNHYYHYDY